MRARADSVRSSQVLGVATVLLLLAMPGTGMAQPIPAEDPTADLHRVAVLPDGDATHGLLVEPEGELLRALERLAVHVREHALVEQPRALRPGRTAAQGTQDQQRGQPSVSAQHTSPPGGVVQVRGRRRRPEPVTFIEEPVLWTCTGDILADGGAEGIRGPGSVPSPRAPARRSLAARLQIAHERDLEPAVSPVRVP